MEKITLKVKKQTEKLFTAAETVVNVNRTHRGFFSSSAKCISNAKKKSKVQIKCDLKQIH